MSKRAKTKLRGRERAAHLTGISTPVGGIDWDPIRFRVCPHIITDVRESETS